MSIEAWQIIAVAFAAMITAAATLAAPSLQELVKYKLSQPKPSPDENAENNPTQPAGERPHKSPRRFLWQYLSIALNIAILLIFPVPEPVTHWKVLAVAALVGLIVFEAAVILYVKAIEGVVEALSFTGQVSARTVLLADALAEEAEVSRQQGELLKAVVENRIAIDPPRRKPPAEPPVE